jgi:hypothetical protein
VPLEGRLGADWGVIVKPESVRFAQLTFEHDDDGCPEHVDRETGQSTSMRRASKATPGMSTGATSATTSAMIHANGERPRRATSSTRPIGPNADGRVWTGFAQLARCTGR